MKGSVYLSPLIHPFAAPQYKPSLMFEIVAVVAVIREQWQTFQSLAHQASAVPAQKQSFRQQTTKQANAGNHRMTRMSLAHVIATSHAATSLPEKPYS